MLACTTVFKILSMAYKIYFEQGSLDIFFIDWETPKNYQLTSNSAPVKGVNPWRRLFVANEFNELQNMRLLSPDIILLLFLVIAEGFGYRYYAQQEVQFNYEKNNSPIDYVLSFFVIFMILFTIATIGYFIQTGIAIWNPPPYLDFVDLCSVTNISIIIFNEELKGYYIHGKSPTGSADVGPQRLRLNLESEMAGNANVRGMHNSPAYADKQHFEILMPKGMIENYRKHYLTKIKTIIDTGNKVEQQMFNEVQRMFTWDKAIPAKVDVQQLYSIEEFTTKLMKQYIDKVCAEPTFYIQRKTAMERFLHTKPAKQNFPIMYIDAFLPSFTNAFLYGLEFDFIIMHVLIIASLERLSMLGSNEVMSRLVLGVLISWIVDGILVWIRSSKGAQNLATHVLINDRFLID